MLLEFRLGLQDPGHHIVWSDAADEGLTTHN
jgi:hypothetical protein